MKSMKFLAAALFSVALAIAASIAVSAYTISFTVFDSKEKQYIYEESGSANSNGSRFCDGTACICYEFPVNTTDKYVSLNWTIANQYAVYVCVTNPDDFNEWKPIYFLEKPADATSADWAPYNPQNITHDLSKYAPLCSKGKVWIIMADSDMSGGWGGYISNSDPVVFKTSQTEPVVGAVAEYIPSTQQNQAAPETETAETVAGKLKKPSKQIDPETYKKPEYGLIGVVISAGIFAVIYIKKRSL